MMETNMTRSKSGARRMVWGASLLAGGSAAFAQTNETGNVISAVTGKVMAVTDNMSALMDGAWKDVGLFGLGFISKIVMSGLMFLVLGALLGFLFYFILKKLKIISLDFSWYKYIGWIWAPLFVLSMALGGGWAGMWRGGEKAIDKAVVQDGVVRKVVANVYTAVALDGSDYESRGDESADDVVALFENSPLLMETAKEELGGKIEEMYATQMKERKLSRWQKFILRAVAQSGFEDKILGSYGDDGKVLFSTVYLYLKDRQAYNDYIAENPGLAPMGAAIGKAITHAETESTRWVRTTTKFNWWIGWLLGAGIPLLLAIAFKVVCHLLGRAKDKVLPDDEPGSPGAAEEVAIATADETPEAADSSSQGASPSEAEPGDWTIVVEPEVLPGDEQDT